MAKEQECNRTRWGKKYSSALYECLGEIKTRSGEKWKLHKKLVEVDTGWINLRLSHCGKFGGRVNYSLGWNSTLDRFARSQDIFSMKVNRPELFVWACEMLKEKGYMRVNWENSENLKEARKL